MTDFWCYDDKPKARGLYSILYCWDPHEGVFPGEAEFDGVDWIRRSNSSVVAFSGPYSTREIALDLAQANDPDLQ